MPRPTPAQLAYGSATVVFATFAMLLLTQSRSATGIAVITVAGLLLGLLVAVTAPLPRAAQRPARSRNTGHPVAAGGPARTTIPAQSASSPAPGERAAQQPESAVGSRRG